MNRAWHRFQRWLRLAAPPAPLVVLLLAPVVATQLFALWTAAELDAWSILPTLHLPRDWCVLFAAATLGGVRVLARHPIFHDEYREFLARTPWERTKPLLLGPVALGLQDVLLVGLLLAVLTFRPFLPPVSVVTTFLFGYSIVLAAALASTGQKSIAYAIMFGLGLLVRVAWFSAEAAGAVAVGTYLIAWWGWWKSLRDFPWTQHLAEPLRQSLDWRSSRKLGAANRGPADHELVWPSSALVTRQPPRRVSQADAWSCALLLGWWAYALAAGESGQPQVGELALLLLTGTSAVSRLCAFLCVPHAVLLPNVSLWSRIRTGRLFIPDYDRVFLAPLIGVAAVLPMFLLMRAMGAPVSIAAAITLTVVLVIVFTAPPRIREWQLLAPVRILPIGQQKGRIEEI